MIYNHMGLVWLQDVNCKENPVYKLPRTSIPTSFPAHNKPLLIQKIPPAEVLRELAGTLYHCLNVFLFL